MKVPPNRFGNELGLRGAPNRGPGCYDNAEVVKKMPGSWLFVFFSSTACKFLCEQALRKLCFICVTFTDCVLVIRDFESLITFYRIRRRCFPQASLKDCGTNTINLDALMCAFYTKTKIAPFQCKLFQSSPSLRSADAFPVVASLPPKNASALRRLIITRRVGGLGYSTNMLRDWNPDPT